MYELDEPVQILCCNLKREMVSGLVIHDMRSHRLTASFS